MTLPGKKLFHRVILMSGSPESSWSLALPGRQGLVRDLLEKLNCRSHAPQPKDNNSETERSISDGYLKLSEEKSFLQCLNKSSVEEIFRAAETSSFSKIKYRSFLAPVEDRKPLCNGNCQSDCVMDSVDLIVGVAKQDSSAYLNYKELSQGVSVAGLKKVMRSFVQNVFFYHKQKVKLVRFSRFFFEHDSNSFS